MGTLILAGAVNTAIVGSNGVLNRVSEDGVLADWFRRPHPRFGTSSRIINLVVGLQILTIILSRGNIYVLGEAYAFGVVWSFVMKGLAVLVLRYKQAGPREFRVPLNFHLGKTEIPVGLGLITLTLLAIAVTNLFTKQVATISGVVFTVVLFAVFTVSERIAHQRGTAHTELDQFHLASGEDITPKKLGCRTGNILALIRDYNTLYPLERVLKRVSLVKQDVVALHIRVLMRAGSGEGGLMPDQFFGTNEQLLFTRALSVAEHEGKTIHLAMVAANDFWDATLRGAQSLRIVGDCSWSFVEDVDYRGGPERRRRVGKASRTETSTDCRHLHPAGQEEVVFLGPHAPHLTPEEIDLLHSLWLRFSSELAPEELHHHDIVYFALNQLKQELSERKDGEILERLRKHLEENKSRRFPGS